MLQKIRFEKFCTVCGKSFSVIRSLVKRRKTCSMDCGFLSFKKSPIDRFWKYVDLPFDATNDECWNWIGGKDKDGYGVFGLSSKRKAIRAHKFSYIFYKGQLGKPLQVCHTCDNPSCVNPSHLFLGTAKDNVQDCHRKGRDRWNKC